MGALRKLKWFRKRNSILFGCGLYTSSLMADRDDDGYSNSCGTNSNDIATKQERSISKLCIHCNTNPTAFLFRRDSLCFSCLETTWVRKTRTNLFKSRPERSDIMSAVFGFTGSVAGAVLLDVLNDALLEDNDAYHATLKRLVNDRYKNRWTLEIVKLEDMLNMSAEDVFMLVDRVSADKTSQEDVLSYLVRSALIRYAKNSNIHRIITAENASTLSVKAISSCAKGRGFQIAEECALVETMSDIDMIFAAPMRENLVDREIAFYFWKKKLECAVGPRLVSHGLSDTKSINGLTKTFLMSLQRGFDHSMHTVLRSTEKLNTSAVPPRPPRTATPAADSSSTPLSNSSSSISSDTQVHRCTFCTRLLSIGERNLPNSLCFSCNNMLFKNIEGADTNPSEALSNFLNSQRLSTLAPALPKPPTERSHSGRHTRKEKAVTRKEMKEHIKDFLIEDAAEADLGAFMEGDS